MVDFSLIENGADSLKKTKISIDLFNESVKQYSYHYIKDATIFLNQSVEVLLKYILSSRNESLIFKDLKTYLDAKKELKIRYSGPVKIENGFGVYPGSEYTVFDTDKGKNLKTIGLNDAIDRVRYFCDIEMSEDLVGAINFINDYRNKLMHHSVRVYSPEEENKFVKRLEFLYEQSLEFFEKHIPGITEKVDQQRFELSKEEWEEHQRDMEEYYHDRAISDLSHEDL
jgi:hypothetical protein